MTLRAALVLETPGRQVTICRTPDEEAIFEVAKAAMRDLARAVAAEDDEVLQALYIQDQRRLEQALRLLGIDKRRRAARCNT